MHLLHIIKINNASKQLFFYGDFSAKKFWLAPRFESTTTESLIAIGALPPCGLSPLLHPKSVPIKLPVPPRQTLSGC